MAAESALMQQREAAAAQAEALASAVRTKESGLAAGEVRRHASMNPHAAARCEGSSLCSGDPFPKGW